MNSLSDNTAVRTFLVGLSFACPLEGGNPEECICHELRKKPAVDRIRILDSLTEEQRLEMFFGHRKCFGDKKERLDQKKTGDQPPPPERLPQMLRAPVKSD